MLLRLLDSAATTRCVDTKFLIRGKAIEVGAIRTIVKKSNYLTNTLLGILKTSRNTL